MARGVEKCACAEVVSVWGAWCNMHNALLGVRSRDIPKRMSETLCRRPFNLIHNKGKQWNRKS